MDAKDLLIENQTEEIETLKEYIEALERKILLLEEKIARLEKNSSNSSRPPSSDIINPQPTKNKKKKRKIGGQMGHPKYNRNLFEADEIDRTVIHKISVEEVRRRGLIPLDKTESVLQQIDLPAKLYTVIDHHVQLYVDPNGEIVKAKLPKDIRRAGLFSVKMTAFTGYLKARCHMSYSTLQSFFNDIMSLDVSQGFLTKICTKKLSPALQQAYIVVLSIFIFVP